MLQILPSSITRIPVPRLAGQVVAMALAMALLVGCKLGPDYQRPSLAAQLPENYTLPQGWKLADPSDGEVLSDWWQRFGDRELDGLIERSMDNNQDLKAAFQRVEQARALSRAVRANWFPAIDFEPSASRDRRSGTVSNTASSVTGITTNQFTLPLSMDYEIDFWGKLRRAMEAAEAETLASEATYRQFRLSLQTELLIQYVALRTTDTEIGIFERERDLRKKSLDLNRKRFEAGDTGEVDVSRAETEWSTTQTELIRLRQQRTELENSLAVLVGTPSPGFHLAARPLASGAPKVPVSLPLDLLERRPDIAAAERRMIAENARIGVAQAAFFPSVSLTGSLGLGTGDIAKLFDADSYFWGLGPEVDFPVVDGGRNKADLQRARARYDEKVAEYRQKVLQAVREVDDALVAIQRLAERAASHEITLKSAGRTVELSQRRYDAGLVAYFDVVDAQRTELDAKQRAAQLQASRHLAVVALIKALGGAWD